MANVYTDAIPLIIGNAAKVLRKKAFLPRLINKSFSPEPMQKGQVVNVPIPGAKTVTDVTPGPTAPAGEDTTLTNVPITLNQWKKASFYLTVKEAAEMANSRDYVNSEMEESVAALANHVNSDIYALYKKVYGYTGTAGTTPFASSPADAINARKVLNNQLAPDEYRYGILGSEAEANALNLAAFQYVQNAGNNSVQQEGQLGRRFGFDWYSSTLIPTHTAGTGSGYLVNNGAGVAVGATSATVDTGTGTILVGDIVTFAGDTQTYVVTSALASNSFSFLPAKVVAATDNAAITVKASHVVNLAFNRNAFAIAMRPTLTTGEMDMPAGTITQVMTDPESGLPFRLDIIPGYMQAQFQVSLLYGVACVRPECAVRIAG